MKLCPKCQKHFSDDANFCPVDAARLVPLEAQAAGADALTSKFDLGPKLGGSRTGSVHRAVDKATGKACVVKLVSPAVLALPGVAQRLERELKQLERVKSAGVCHVLASGKRGDDTWLATELLDGAQTLAEAIGARGPLPQDRAADLIELIGEALIEAAQVGVVHRDLAPKNILFAGSDIKLINFSLPVPHEKVPGVAEFVAPEQVDGRPVDQRSNLYSLGALYYYVLTGQTPFAGGVAEVHALHSSGTIRPPSQLVPVAQPIETVIMRALDRSPTKRFLTVRQFVDEVSRVGHGEVIELKQTMAMGKANARPKGDLVQTLLGVRGVFPGMAPVPVQPPANLSPITSAPTVNPQPAVQSVVVAQAPVPSPPATTLGLGQPTVQSAPPMMPPPMDYQPGSGMAAALASPASAMSPLTPPGVEPLNRSPWAGPGGGDPAIAATAPAPIVLDAPAPVVAAPVLAAPVVAPQAAGKQPAGKRSGNSKPPPVKDEGKGRFRETMWFKKGELDAQAAISADEERKRTGKEAGSDKADSKAMDERYNDDGTITRGDAEKYSLRTGATQMMASIKDKPGHNASQSLSKVSEDQLIGEMKGLPKWMIGAIIGGVIAVILLIIVLAT